MSDEQYDIEPQGDGQYVVTLTDGEETVETWFRVTADSLAQLGVDAGDEADLVERTVVFLRRHQEVPDFPDMVEIEDVLATYPDYRDAVTSDR
ncbi:hypothetical protein [Klenkia sp. PcliD-1-E]|uniref:hypothetical protein n=1 Tax=Klenkia sp. PcliD-1-E TaxID=2954492 RepID=UPI002097414A|nr:hypothetical protein [Klenkia sp. PcliD-1-E]MCO7221341.1 hypothetical protein [Klenkia sp. PcliD-1-E]